MKKSFIFVLSVSLAMAAGANSPQAGKPVSPNKREAVRHVRIQPPVYASSGQFEHNRKPINPAAMTPEMRSKFEAARKRRFEIMVLIGAYKIMPEDQKAALKVEILKRIDEDFQAMIVDQKERIAKAEADLKRFRSELNDRENRKQELIERELDRLLKIPAYNGRRIKRPENSK